MGGKQTKDKGGSSAAPVSTSPATAEDWAIVRDALKNAPGVAHADWWLPFVLSTAPSAATTCTRAKIVLDGFRYALVSIPPPPTTDRVKRMLSYGERLPDLRVEVYVRRERSSIPTDIVPEPLASQQYRKKLAAAADELPYTFPSVNYPTASPHLADPRFVFDPSLSRVDGAYFSEGLYKSFTPNLLVFSLFDPAITITTGTGTTLQQSLAGSIHVAPSPRPVWSHHADPAAQALVKAAKEYKHPPSTVKWMLGRTEPSLNAKAIAPVLHALGNGGDGSGGGGGGMWPRELAWVIAEYADSSLSQYFTPGKPFSLSYGHVAYLHFPCDPPIHLSLALMNFSSPESDPASGRHQHSACAADLTARSGENTRTRLIGAAGGGGTGVLPIRLFPGFESSLQSYYETTGVSPVPYSVVISVPHGLVRGRGSGGDELATSLPSLRVSVDLELAHHFVGEYMHCSTQQWKICFLSRRTPPAKQAMGRVPTDWKSDGTGSDHLFYPLTLSNLPANALAYQMASGTTATAKQPVATATATATANSGTAPPSEMIAVLPSVEAATGGTPPSGHTTPAFFRLWGFGNQNVFIEYFAAGSSLPQKPPNATYDPDRRLQANVSRDVWWDGDRLKLAVSELSCSNGVVVLPWEKERYGVHCVWIDRTGPSTAVVLRIVEIADLLKRFPLTQLPEHPCYRDAAHGGGAEESVLGIKCTSVDLGGMPQPVKTFRIIASSYDPLTDPYWMLAAAASAAGSGSNASGAAEPTPVEPGVEWKKSFD